MIKSIDALQIGYRGPFVALSGLQVRRQRALAVLRTLLEKSPSPEVPHTDTGSFDCVRLSPHFAQDDRSDWAVISMHKA
jgi:hypothetical protein